MCAQYKAQKEKTTLPMAKAFGGTFTALYVRTPDSDQMGQEAVSYTHLDVYKRQSLHRAAALSRPVLWNAGCILPVPVPGWPAVSRQCFPG